MCLLSSSDRCLVGWWAGDSRILGRAYGGRRGEAPPATTSEPIASFVERVASAAKSKAGHGPSEAGGSGRYPDQVSSVGSPELDARSGPLARWISPCPWVHGHTAPLPSFLPNSGRLLARHKSMLARSSTAPCPLGRTCLLLAMGDTAARPRRGRCDPTWLESVGRCLPRIRAVPCRCAASAAWR